MSVSRAYHPDNLPAQQDNMTGKSRDQHCQPTIAVVFPCSRCKPCLQAEQEDPQCQQIDPERPRQRLSALPMVNYIGLEQTQNTQAKRSHGGVATDELSMTKNPDYIKQVRTHCSHRMPPLVIRFWHWLDLHPEALPAILDLLDDFRQSVPRLRVSDHSPSPPTRTPAPACSSSSGHRCSEMPLPCAVPPQS